MGVLVSVILAAMVAVMFVWFFHWLERYRREWIYLFGGVFGWGVVTGAFAALFLALAVPWGMAFHLESEAFEVPRRFLFLAPLVEEGFKALAILAVMLMFRREFSYLPEGMVYGGVIAAGFAASQNVFYFYHVGYLEGGIPGLLAVFVQRGLCGGFTAVLCGAGIGAGLAWAQRRPKQWQRWHTAITLWTGVYLCHIFRNALVLVIGQQNSLPPLTAGMIVDSMAWLVAGVLVLGLLQREYQRFLECLRREVKEGWIKPEQAELLKQRFWKARLQMFLPLCQDRTCRVIFLFSELAEQQVTAVEPVRGSDGRSLSLRLHQELARLVSQLPQAS
ncbi:MAG: PrsW family intramembrane metalloprotease [Thermogutta sp.]